MIRGRKSPAASLHLGSHPQALEKFNCLLIRKSIKRAVQKFGIAHNPRKKLIHLTDVGKIAPAFACNKQLFPQLFILFEQMHAAPPLRRKYCGSHSGGASSYD